MSYNINYNVSPRLNLYKAINTLNSKDYKITRFSVEGQVNYPDGHSDVTVGLKYNIPLRDIDKVTFKLKRAPLEEIFSIINEKKLNKFLPGLVKESGGVSPNLLINEFKRRFSFYIDEYMYDIGMDNNIVTITAKETNPMFSGTISFEVVGYILPAGELKDFTDVYGDYKALLVETPLTVVKRDETGSVSVTGVTTQNPSSDEFDGDMVLNVNDTLSIVVGKDNTLSVLGGNSITVSETPPEHPVFNDIWFEV